MNDREYIWDTVDGTVKHFRPEHESERLTYNNYSRIVKEKEQRNPNAINVKEDRPKEQPLPITIDNFFIKTFAVFNQIPEIPDGYSEFFRSGSNSVYYTNADKSHIVRASNHWGSKIRECAWFLKTDQSGTYEKIPSYKWQKVYGNQVRYGLVNINQFLPRTGRAASSHDTEKIREIVREEIERAFKINAEEIQHFDRRKE